MSQSPTKRPLLFTKRDSYAHTTHDELRYLALNSQKSPIIGSPILNQESQYDKLCHSPNSDLKTKLQIVLKHNSRLLNENATLSEMVNSLRMEVDLKNRKEEANMIRVNNELNLTVEEMKNHQFTHEGELERLLNEISNLHEQCYNIQAAKNNQIKKQKENQDRELAQQVNQLRRANDDSKEIMDLQIKRLKESLEMKQFETQSFKSQSKNQIQSLRSENNTLREEVKHIRKLNDLQTNQTIMRNKEQINTVIKQIEREKNIEIVQKQNNIKKLKKQLLHKNIEMEQVSKQAINQTEEIYEELSTIKQDQQNLLEELQELTEGSQKKVQKEKQRVTQLAQMEKQNLQNTFQNQRDCMKGERQKLVLLCVEKTHQIQKLYSIINQLKATHSLDKKSNDQFVKALKNRLNQLQSHNHEELQLLKIKMGQLHEADIKSLQNFYENHTSSILQQLNDVQEAHTTDRKKLHQLLQENHNIRKNFEIELSKQKAKVQDMKVKLAAANVEFKEKITSLGTKMQLTSQTLLRETEQKQKGAEFFQTEKKKFYKIIENKDHEIATIEEAMKRFKQSNNDEIDQFKNQLQKMRDLLDEKEKEFKQYKTHLEKEFEKKKQKLRQEIIIGPDENLLNEIDGLKVKLDEAEKDAFKKQKDLEFMIRENKSLQQELGLRAGFVETMQLESSAAIEDEKTKIKILMGKNQVTMKQYYEEKLSSRQKDNQALKNQLAEKEGDIRELMKKYHILEDKLRQLMNAQQKLSQFETKIINLGMDQNLVKNMAELFKKYRN